MVTPPYPAGPRHGRVVHALGARIVRGDLEPGTSVPVEDQLVAEFGVGRSAVREGVKVLVGKGLLETRTSAGTRIRPRSSWNLLDPEVLGWRYEGQPSLYDTRILADLRVALEPGAARVAAERADRAAVRAIDEAMAALHATADDADAFIEADLAFHRAIFAASDNDLLLYIYEMVAIALRSVREVHTRSIEHNKETLPNHEKVAVAIRRHQHRKAEETMREVVEVARADTEQFLGLCCGS
ncbi:FadR/GntR family transcriptional regulator [Rugosimonospora acidiphila]|uniref:FadR/GntR family transcriptional regulator n=1 Tax=Rugosimonospora acidiphila TaxID=556531 RepID=A0ABP9S269_9ACTN